MINRLSGYFKRTVGKLNPTENGWIEFNPDDVPNDIFNLKGIYHFIHSTQSHELMYNVESIESIEYILKTYKEGVIWYYKPTKWYGREMRDSDGQVMCDETGKAILREEYRNK